MRLKWEANFNIEDATIQLGEAYVNLIKYTNVNDTCHTEYNISDESGDNIVKSFKRVFDRNFANEIEFFIEIQNEFSPSEIVD